MERTIDAMKLEHKNIINTSILLFIKAYSFGEGEGLRISPTRLHPDPDPFFCPMRPLENTTLRCRI